jgi:hypothetical protein
MPRQSRRITLWQRIKEPVRWTVCFAAAAALEVYASIHGLLGIVVVPPSSPPPPIQVKLWRREPPELPSALHERVREAARQFEVERKMVEESRSPEDAKVVSPAELRRRIEEAAERAEHPKDAGKALSKADELSRKVRVGATEEIADFLGYQERGDYVPKDPPPEGPFDFNDAVPYDIEKAAAEDGTPSYRITLVDRAGRIHQFIVPPEQDPSQFDTLYRIMNSARDNPQLRIILQRMVMPMIGKMRRGQRRIPPQRPAPPPKK